MNGVDHQVIIESGLGRQGHIPCLFKLGSDDRVVHLLVAGEVIRHRAMVACALHVVMPAQGVSARSWLHVISRGEQQIRDGR